MVKPCPLEVRDLTVGYGRPLIPHISFQVPAGEIVALIGPNGSGKSTILKTISGQLDSLGGQVLLGGRELGRLPARERSQKLALLLTEPVRPERMTCREVVEMGRYPYTGYFGGLSSEDARVVEASMALVEMEGFSNALFTEVSDGQRQRVMLARAVCQEPEVLLLDEPTAFLDIYHKAVFFELLRRLTQERRLAVLVSMHEPELAARAAGYAVCLREGEVFRRGPAREVLTPEGVREQFGLPEALYDRYFGPGGG